VHALEMSDDDVVILARQQRIAEVEHWCVEILRGKCGLALLPAREIAHECIDRSVIGLHLAGIALQRRDVTFRVGGGAALRAGA